MPHYCAFFLLTILGSLVACSPAVLPAAEPTAEIVECGRYQCKITGTRPTTDTTSANVVVDSTEEELVESTQKIPCRLGESFGFRLRFSNLPRSRPYVLREVISHPPITQPDGRVLTESVSNLTVPTGMAPDGLSLWHFRKEYPYELVPGKWTHIVYVDDAEVARITFDVVKGE